MILLFGAAGFVGTYLMDRYMLDDEIIAVDTRDTCELSMHGDITDKDIFRQLKPSKKFKIDCVVNLASLQPDNVKAGNADPENYIQVNTIGVLNILKYCVENKIKKFIHMVSHRSVVNRFTNFYYRHHGLDEEVNYRIDYNSEFAEFAISEMAAIEMINCYAMKYKLQTIVLRVPAIFGYGPHLEGFRNGKPYKTGFQIFIDNALAGKPIELWGNTAMSRDILYVKDAVSAIQAAIKSKKANGLYNIASDHVELYQEVLQILDYFSASEGDRIIFKRDKPNDIDFCKYDISKAALELKWKPKYNFKNMLRDYDKERLSGKRDYLVEDRRRMLK